MNVPLLGVWTRDDLASVSVAAAGEPPAPRQTFGCDVESSSSLVGGWTDSRELFTTGSDSVDLNSLSSLDIREVADELSDRSLQQ